MSKPKPLSYPNIVSKMSVKTGLTEKTIRKVFDAFFLLVSEELRFAEEFRLREFGKFYLVQKGGKDKGMPTRDGEYVKKYITPFKTIKFKPSDNLINFVNGRLVKKKRLKKQLSKKDLQLENYSELIEDRDRKLDFEIDNLIEKL